MEEPEEKKDTGKNVRCYDEGWLKLCAKLEPVATDVCLVCKQIAKNAVELTCEGHIEGDSVLIVGEECLNKYLQENDGECPSKNGHSNCTYTKSRVVRKRIENLEVIVHSNTKYFKQNRESNAECQYKGKIKDIQEHLEKMCPLYPIDCPFRKCGYGVHLDLVSKHAEQLQIELVTCEAKLEQSNVQYQEHITLLQVEIWRVSVNLRANYRLASRKCWKQKDFLFSIFLFLKKYFTANINFGSNNVRVISNALVVMIGISKYHDNKVWPNLPNIKTKDLVNFKELFEKKFNYDFVCNHEPSMAKDDVHEFFANLMINYKLCKNSRHYDALIVILCAHGEEGDMLVTSDGKKVPVDKIRTLFDCHKLKAFKDCPKIFIVDIDRGRNIPTDYKMVMRGREKHKREHSGDGFFTIWSTTKGSQ
ncbi:hypothetical protein RFI_05607, partial [Reticulomyxa filosa]